MICVLLGDPAYEALRDIRDLDETAMRRIAQFYEPFFPLMGWLGKDAALEFLKETHMTFRDRLKKHGAASVIEREDADEFPDEFEPDDDDQTPEAKPAATPPSPTVSEEGTRAEQP